MSTCISKEVSCPNCSAVKKTQMWPGMTVTVNPELRKKVLDETLFDWKCPDCGYESQMVYPCLYHDKNRKLMICVAPSGNTELLQKMEERFPQLEGVKKRSVASLKELKEKVLIFESGLNDAAVELVKLALTEILQKRTGNKVDSGYFYQADRAVNRISFLYYFHGKDEPVCQKTLMDGYDKALEIASRTFREKENEDFLYVNEALAQQLYDNYQSADGTL